MKKIQEELKYYINFLGEFGIKLYFTNTEGVLLHRKGFFVKIEKSKDKGYYVIEFSIDYCRYHFSLTHKKFMRYFEKELFAKQEEIFGEEDLIIWYNIKKDKFVLTEKKLKNLNDFS